MSRRPCGEKKPIGGAAGASAPANVIFVTFGNRTNWFSRLQKVGAGRGSDPSSGNPHPFFLGCEPAHSGNRFVSIQFGPWLFSYFLFYDCCVSVRM